MAWYGNVCMQFQGMTAYFVKCAITQCSGAFKNKYTGVIYTLQLDTFPTLEYITNSHDVRNHA